jgi:3-phosphoshikimate 1-carboxyvinyltransferase
LTAAGGASAREGAAFVRSAARLRGEPRLPGDKSISHRALLLALLAEGESTILQAGDGEDVRTTAMIVARLGATVERLADRGGRVDYRVISPGRERLIEPDGILDCRNSGTTLRLTAGIVASRPLFAILDGDASLRRRPVARVTRPLAEMGATVDARAGGTLPPVAVRGAAPLRPIDHATAVPSAQVKSAILLAGLGADGTTTVREAVATRDHTERMLRARGVPVRTEPWRPEATGVGTADEGDAGSRVSVDGPARVAPVGEAVPSDPSAAAFWLVAGAAHPDAELVLRSVGTNPTRRAIIDLLRRMGASIDETPLGGGGDGGDGEPVADLVVRSSELHGIDVSSREVAAAIDEVPVLCLAAALASGTTRIDGVGELRHKESDRVAGIATGLSAMGAHVEVDGDTMTIEGGRRLAGAATESLDDHRLAMTFAIAGLIAGGETAVTDAGCASVSYPGFFDEIERVRA